MHSFPSAATRSVVTWGRILPSTSLLVTSWTVCCQGRIETLAPLPPILPSKTTPPPLHLPPYSVLMSSPFLLMSNCLNTLVSWVHVSYSVCVCNSLILIMCQTLNHQLLTISEMSSELVLSLLWVMLRFHTSPPPCSMVKS